MEKIIDIINFYKNVNSTFGLADFITHLSAIHDKIWEGPDLCFYDIATEELKLLGNENKPESLITHYKKIARYLPREVENYARTVIINDQTVIFCYFNICQHEHGFLFTIPEKENIKQLSDIEKKFIGISSFLVAQSFKHTSRKYDLLNDFILELFDICGTSDTIEDIIKKSLKFIKKHYKDFDYELVYIDDNIKTKYLLDDDNLVVLAAKEQYIPREDADKIFSFPNENLVLSYINDGYKDIGYLRINSRYLHFWNEEIENHFKIFGYILGQCLHKTKLYSDMKKESMMLKELIDFRQDITAMIAHDLSSPLMGIMGYLSILRGIERQIPANAMNYVNKSYNLTIRLNKMVEDFRTINQLEQGSLVIKPEKTPVGMFFKEIVKFFLDLYPMTININNIDNIEYLHIDPYYFSRVVENLLNNAVKYAGQDVKIELNLKREDKKVKLEVINNGPPIPEEDIGRIFDKYKRSGSNLRVYGSGLGLFICKTVVDMHKGTITVRNLPERGVVFVIQIPEN